MAEDDPKRVGVAELKAKLSEHLRLVEDGETLVVMNHKRPVARIVPYEEIPKWRLRAKPPRNPVPHAGKATMERLKNRPPAPQSWIDEMQRFLDDDRKR